AAHPEQACHQLRMEKGKIGGVKGAEARPRGDQRGGGIVLRRERRHLFNEIAIILDVTAHTLVGRSPLGVPALGVYAVYTVELNRAPFQGRARRLEHAEVFPLVEGAERGGKDEDARPASAEDEQLHLALQRWAKPLMVVAIHGVPQTLSGATRTKDVARKAYRWVRA